MILETYQSMLVVNTLREGRIYRALPSISLRDEYAALIDMLDMKCRCPVFAVVKGRKQNTGGKVSGRYRITLDVPEDEIKFTEYRDWADFIYYFKYSQKGNYRKLQPGYCEEIPETDYQKIIERLKDQKKQQEYDTPQALLEEIKPEWMKSYTECGKENGIIEAVKNLFGR
jgi:hypothetical protein